MEEKVEKQEKELTFEEKVELVHQYNEIVKANKLVKENCEKVIKENEEKIEVLKKDILAYMQEKGDKEFVTKDNLYVNVSVNSTTGYEDESAVIEFLKENGYEDFIRVTTAIDKKKLNAELKTNATLKEGINSFITTKNTPYVVVTDEENHTKMLEHINESVAKKVKKGN